MGAGPIFPIGHLFLCTDGGGRHVVILKALKHWDDSLVFLLSLQGSGSPPPPPPNYPQQTRLYS